MNPHAGPDAAGAELHTLTGGYALDALDAEERVEFEQHLDECESCRQEVAELSATSARLGAAAWSPAPAGLRARVLAEVAGTRQQPPLVDQSASARRRADLAWFRQPLGVAASILLVLTLGLAAFATAQSRRADQAEQLATRIAAVATDPGAVKATRPLPSGGQGTLVSARGQAIFRASGLPALPGDRTYQLWVIDASGGARSAGVLGRAVGGDVQQFVPHVAAAETIGLTVEPSGGSEAPTSDPLLTVPVRA
jgi:anti-sigma-K factor RskA